MATAVPSADESAFDAMTEEITAVFDRILREVISRRDQLLSEVGKKRQDFKLKNSAMMENLRELEEMRTYLEKMSVKQNLALKKKEDSLAEIDSEIDKLKRDAYSCIQLKYSCSPDQLIQQVKQFGEVIDAASILYKYSQKVTAVKIVRDIENHKFASQISFHLDSSRQLLYVLQLDRDDILIFNANDLKFVRSFGLAKFNPSCVATSKEFVYVVAAAADAYRSHRLFQLKISDYSLFAEIQIQGCLAVAVSSENQVLTLHSSGFFRIYDRVLNLKEEVTLEFDKFGKSSCKQMILREDIFYLLYNESILTVALGDWDNIRYLFKTENGKF